MLFYVLYHVVIHMFMCVYVYVELSRNIEESAHVKMGQYHTIDIEVGQAFWIGKYMYT